MRKIYFFLIALLMPIFSYAQMSIVEVNDYTSKNENILGGMCIKHIEILPKLCEGHLVGSVLGVYEAFLVKHEKTLHALRLTTGLGYANQEHTLAGGVMFGARTDGFKEVKKSFSFWAYAEKGKFTFQTIYIDLEAYLFEVGYKVSSEKPRVHFSLLLANHGPNWGIGVEAHDIKSGLYGFISPTIRWYGVKTNSSGQMQDVFVVNPTDNPYGIHAAFGKKFSYHKTFPKVEG